MLFKPKMLLLLFLFELLSSKIVNAQAPDSLTAVFAKQLNYYGIKKASTLMFVHLDKTVYVNNDIMWFTAYLLNRPVGDSTKHQVLSVALVNSQQEIYAKGKYIMFGSFGFGNITLPDSLSPGNYSFMAFTNNIVNGQPDAYFVQPITVKTVAHQSYSTLLYLDTLKKMPGIMQATIVTNAKSLPVKGALVNYSLGKDKLTRITGHAKTDAAGMYTMQIPAKSVTSAQHTLNVQVKYNGETKTLHLPLPVKHPVNDVKFYPEGGHLITGIRGRIGWEAKTATGIPIKTAAILYADKDIIDTVETDSFGMGMFNLIPFGNTKYTLKLLGNKIDSVYTLPAALNNNGLVLHLPDALARDSLTVQIQSKYSGKILMLLHNYSQLFVSAVLAPVPGGNLVKIDLADVPRGLNTITLLDSLKRPFAERMFFAHYDKRSRLNIVTDKKEFGTRQKVNVKLKLTNAKGIPANGIVSVACVQDSRFEVKNDNNIKNYFYLQSKIDDLPLKDDLLGNAEIDRQYLNELLLVRGWSKYKWPELIETNAADTIRKQNSLIFKGEVAKWEKPLKKPVDIILMTDSLSINMFKTEPGGSFALSNQSVYVNPGQKAKFIVNGHSDQYSIKINDPYDKLNETLAQTITPVVYEEPTLQDTQDLVLKGLDHVTYLKEVKITATNGGFLHAFNANACGDYVCSYNILNCPNHRNDSGNKPAVRGQTYYVMNVGKEIYYGCNETAKQGMLVFNGIYAAKEFYGADYASLNPPDADYLSTVYWKHSMLINADKGADFSFYTSDITGRYRIVVQGLTNDDVIYGENSFMVQKSNP